MTTQTPNPTPTTRPAAAAPDPRSLLLRHRDFTLLWCGEVAGKFGASVTGIAMPLTAITVLDAGTFEVGVLAAAAWLPWLLIGLPVGAWVDRWPRRPVMLASAGFSTVLFAAVPVLAHTGVLSIGVLLAAAFLGGIAAVFFQTAYTAYLPGILAPEDQAEGNAKLHGSASAAQLAGRGAGGLVAQAAGTVNALLVNSATFAASAACLAAIRHREPARPRTPRPRGALAAEVREGLALVFRDPWLRTLTLFSTASNVALIGLQTLQVVFLVRTIGLDERTVGLLIAATGAGGIAGAFAARRTATRLGTARASLVFELGVGSLTLLTPLTTAGWGLTWFAAGGFATSAGVVAGNVVKAGFHQAYCPPALLGRVGASTAFLNYGIIPVGALLAGTLGTALGPRTAVWITAAGVPATALILWFSPLRTVRDLPTRNPAPTPTLA